MKIIHETRTRLDIYLRFNLTKILYTVVNNWVTHFGKKFCCVSSEFKNNSEIGLHFFPKGAIIAFSLYYQK